MDGQSQVQLTEHDEKTYKDAVAELRVEPPSGHRAAPGVNSSSDLLAEVRRLWEQGEMFIVTGVVSTPYSGCWHEPNIWLVEPRCEYEIEIVKPLYASGQGLGVDIVHCFADLCTWLSQQDLSDVLMQDDRISARCKRHGMLSPSGSFDSFAVHPGDGILNDMGPAEHYWAQAIKAADSEWNEQLKWRCDECGKITEGGEDESEPVFTSYRGNGGIGVFMDHVLCQECVDAGMCDICKEHIAPHDGYDSDVAAHGWNICDYHTEEAFKGMVTADDEIELPKTVFLGYIDADYEELALFSEYEKQDSKLLVEVDSDVLHRLERAGLCCISDYVCKKGSYSRQLQLPGDAIERCIEIND